MAEQRVSFRLDGDFKVSVGNPAFDVTIPRLKFKDAESVINIVSKSAALSAKASIKTIMATRKPTNGQLFDIDSVSQSIENILPELMRMQSFGVINELFGIMTYGVIRPEIAETMDYREMCELIAFLVRENFSSLKNLSASFETITMSESNENRS